jgi:hypothetical protein
MQTVLGAISSGARLFLNDRLPYERMPEILARFGGWQALFELLTEWSQSNPQPLVLLLDEVDALIGDTLISLLRQLRSGYDNRPLAFPHSIILCGVCDVRDYRIHSSRSQEIITGGSAFNIKSESLRLGDFTPEEVERLYRQHTAETGQVFEDGALGAGAVGLNSTYAAKDQAKKMPWAAPSLQELDKAAAEPVLKLAGLKSPVIIEYDGTVVWPQGE